MYFICPSDVEYGGQSHNVTNLETNNESNTVKGVF